MTNLINKLRKLAEKWRGYNLNAELDMCLDELQSILDNACQHEWVHALGDGSASVMICCKKCGESITAGKNKHDKPTAEVLDTDNPEAAWSEKPADSSEPEYRLFEIIRGYDDWSEESIRVNEILPEICRKVAEKHEYLNLIGYKYAESDVITCIGPNAWWDSKQDPANFAPDHHCRFPNQYPIFATHAVYMQAQETNQ